MVDINELESPELRKYLIENWYLVPEEHDDQQLVDECRAVLTLMDSWPRKIHAFHIFTTLDCNARCFYCFEKRMPGSDMTMETASRAVEYMQEQADGELIKIVWFGGEPLFNFPVIDFITNGLKEKGLQFESDMISNGLLFDDELVEKAKNIWNVKSVQITLDGTRQVYKRVKAYVTDEADPFEIVLLMRDLVDFLCEEFKGEDNLYVYTSPLIELNNYTYEQKTFIFDLQDELNSKLNPLFQKKEKKEFADKITNSYCMATGREAVTILPDGKVGICENITSGTLLGDIYTKELDVRAREEFGRRFYREDKCRPCPMYPNCYIANGCPNKDPAEGCDPVRVQRQIKRIQRKLKARCRLGASGNGAESAQ